MGLPRKNSLDFIRFIAAGCVVFSHSFAVTGNKEPLIPNTDISLGAVAVWIFFILSGYLISASWDQYPRFNVFFAKRALRIFPGLAVNIIICIIILGIFFSSFRFADYIFQQGTISYLSNIFLYNISTELPGVFTSNPFAPTVNGSIWTLPYEFTLYILIALIGVFNVYKKVSALHLWIILFVMELIAIFVNPGFFSLSLFYLRIDVLLLWSLMFFSGVVLYKYKSEISLSYKWGAISLVALLILSLSFDSFIPLIAAVFLSYSLFSLGRSPVFSSFSKIGDMSYGVYIYSWPVQQALCVVTETNNPLKMFGASIFISIILGWISWQIVESKALKLKKRIKTDRYPLINQPDTAW